MENKDYYKSLGVEKTADKAAIKKAYRKLAMKYHPDKTKGDNDAEEKFKEISVAYAVLSNDEKRKQYDMEGSDKFHKQFSQEDIFRGANINDTFGDIFKESGISGDNIFSQIFGQGVRRGFSSSSHGGGFNGISGQDFQGYSGRQDLTMKMEITLFDSFHGGEKHVIYESDKKEDVTVKIPKGVATGQKLRLKGKGVRGGDLYIAIKVTYDPVFKRDGNDLIIEREVKLTDAALGCTLETKTMDGTINIKVPQNMQSHSRIRIKGKGMPFFKGNGVGDLYVRIIVRLPKELSESQIKLLGQLKEEGL